MCKYLIKSSQNIKKKPLREEYLNEIEKQNKRINSRIDLSNALIKSLAIKDVTRPSKTPSMILASAVSSIAKEDENVLLEIESNIVWFRMG